MPLPQKKTRGGWWWVRLLMLAAFLLAAVVAFVADFIKGDPDEPHRPPHVTSTPK